MGSAASRVSASTVGKRMEYMLTVLGISLAALVLVLVIVASAEFVAGS